MNDDDDRVLNVCARFCSSSFSFLHSSPHFRSTIKPLCGSDSFLSSLYFMLSMTTGNDGYMLPIQRRLLLVADRFYWIFFFFLSALEKNGEKTEATQTSPVARTKALIGGTWRSSSICSASDVKRMKQRKRSQNPFKR